MRNTRNAILMACFVALSASGQESCPPPEICPVCSPPESDLLPMLVVVAVIFGGGWLIRTLWARRKRR